MYEETSSLKRYQERKIFFFSKTFKNHNYSLWRDFVVEIFSRLKSFLTWNLFSSEVSSYLKRFQLWNHFQLEVSSNMKRFQLRNLFIGCNYDCWMFCWKKKLFSPEISPDLKSLHTWRDFNYEISSNWKSLQTWRDFNY